MNDPCLSYVLLVRCLLKKLFEINLLIEVELDGKRDMLRLNTSVAKPSGVSTL